MDFHRKYSTKINFEVLVGKKIQTSSMTSVVFARFVFARRIFGFHFALCIDMENECVLCALQCIICFDKHHHVIQHFDRHGGPFVYFQTFTHISLRC